MDLIIKEQLIFFQLSLIRSKQQPLTDLIIRRIFDYLLVLQCSFWKVKQSRSFRNMSITLEIIKTCFQWRTHKNLQKIKKGYEIETYRLTARNDKGKIIEVKYPSSDGSDGWLYRDASEPPKRREKIWFKIKSFEKKKKELEMNYIFKDQNKKL